MKPSLGIPFVASLLLACGPQRLIELSDTVSVAEWGQQLTFPQSQPLPFSVVERRVNNDPSTYVQVPIASATLTALGGPCSVSGASDCSASIVCGGQLTFDAYGACAVQVQVQTVDGDSLEHCWTVARFQEPNVLPAHDTAQRAAEDLCRPFW